MSVAPADFLKSLLREAETALASGEFADAGAPASVLAGLIERSREDAIGASPERLAELAERLRQGLAEVRRSVSSLRAETTRRLQDLVMYTWGQEVGADPATARDLRRERRDALTILTARRDEVRLGELNNACASLEARSAAAPAPRATHPESLPSWIERVESLVGRVASGDSPARSAWETALLEARGLDVNAPAAALTAAAETLAGVSLELEGVLLRQEALARQATEMARLKALELIQDADLRPEERWVLEGEVGRLGLMRSTPEPPGSLMRRLEAMQGVLQGRRDRAHARLQAALLEARDADIDPANLTPSADPSVAALHGTPRFLAGSARLEALLSLARFSALESRLIAAIEAAWRHLLGEERSQGSRSLLSALEDLKIRAAAEVPDAVAEALESLERMLAGAAPAGALAPGPSPPPVPAEDLSALEVIHPSGAKVWRELVDWAGVWGPAEVQDLLEQGVMEAGTARQVQGSVSRGTG